MFNAFFCPENHASYNVENMVEPEEVTYYNMAHAHCLLDN